MEKEETLTNKIRTLCEYEITDSDSINILNTKPQLSSPKIQTEMPPVDTHEDKLDIDMFDDTRNRCNLPSPQRKNKRPAMMGKDDSYSKAKMRVVDVPRDRNDEPKLTVFKTESTLGKKISTNKAKVKAVSKLDVLKDWDDDPELPLLKTKSEFCNKAALNKCKLNTIRVLKISKNKSEPLSKTFTSAVSKMDTRDGDNTDVLNKYNAEYKMPFLNSNKGKYAVNEPVMHIKNKCVTVKNPNMFKELSNESELQLSKKKVDTTNAHTKDKSTDHRILFNWNDKLKMPLSKSNKDICMKNEQITCIKDKITVVKNVIVLKGVNVEPKMQLLTNRKNISAVASETVANNRVKITAVKNVVMNNKLEQTSLNSNKNTCAANEPPTDTKDKMTTVRNLTVLKGQSNEFEMQERVSAVTEAVPHNKDVITAIKNLDVLEDQSKEPEMQEDISAVVETVSHSKDEITSLKSLDVPKDKNKLQLPNNKISVVNKTNACNKEKHIAAEYLNIIEDWNDEPELGLLKNKNKSSADTHKDTTAVDILKDWNYEHEETPLKIVKVVSSADKQIAQNKYRSVVIKALDVSVNKNNKAKLSVSNGIKIPAVGRKRAIVNVPKDLEDELMSDMNLDEHSECKVKSAKNLDVPEDPEAKQKTVINLNFDVDPKANIMSVINLDMDEDPRDEVRAVGKLDSGKHPLSKEIRENKELVKNLSCDSKLNKENCQNESKTATANNSNLVNKPCYIPKISFPKKNESPVVYRVIPIPKHFIDSNNPKKINYSAIKNLKESQVIKISNGGIVTTSGGNSCLSESMLKRITEQLVQKREEQRVVATKEDCVVQQKEDQRITFAKEECIVKQKEGQRPTAKEEYVVKQKEERKMAAVKEVSRVREFSCKICNKKFKYLKALEKHETTGHVKEITYDCDECPRWFTCENDLQRHKSFHSRFKKLLCKFCKKKFKSQNSLNKHMINHEEETRGNNCETENHDTTGHTYSCNECPKWFTCPKGLQAHIKFFHLRFEKLFCKICKKKYKSQCTFDNHMMHHGKETGRYNCATCGEGFFLKTQLTEHLLTHYQYSCSFCDEKLICLKDKIIHENTHVRNKQFECMICRKIFPNKYTYDLHLPIHEGNKIHKCKVCGLTYVYESNLILHMRSHEVHVKYCDFCHKQFSSDSELKRHIDTHFGISHDSINTSETIESEQLTIENEEKSDERTIQPVESFHDKEAMVRTAKKEETFQITETVQNKVATQTDRAVSTEDQNCTINSKEHQNCASNSEEHQNCSSNSEEHQNCSSNSEEHQNCASNSEEHQNCASNSEEHQNCASNSEEHQNCTSNSEEPQNCASNSEEHHHEQQNMPELITVNTGVKDIEENHDVPRSMPELITYDADVANYESRHGQQNIDTDVKDDEDFCHDQQDMSEMFILHNDIKPSISELMEYSELFTSRERISESRRKEAQVRYPLRKIPNPREACTIEEMRYLRRKFYQYKRYQRHLNKSFKAWELPKTRIVKLKSDGSKLIAVKRFSVPSVPPKEIPKESRGSLLISDNFEDL